MAQQLCQSFGVGLAALVVHLSLLWHGHAAMTPDDIAPGFFAIGTLALLSSIVFWRLPPHAGAELTRRR
jgi:hypothetical protein